MKDTEIELKIQINNPEKLFSFLKNKATFLGRFQQTDYYFDPPHKTFMYTDETGYKSARDYFRVRISDKGPGSVGYKRVDYEPKDTAFTHCEEIECDIKNTTNMIKILKFLECRPTAVIKKERESYSYRDFQFDCDTVEGLGVFIEIEYKGDAVSKSEGEQKILSIMHEVGITEWEEARGGYVAMMWNKTSPQLSLSSKRDR